MSICAQGSAKCCGKSIIYSSFCTVTPSSERSNWSQINLADAGRAGDGDLFEADVLIIELALDKIPRYTDEIRKVSGATMAAMMAPCSVKVSGSFLVPPQLDVANCDFKLANSAGEV